jgi:1-acyl-sn-glycerol-3-phosphate acyltransferase
MQKFLPSPLLGVITFLLVAFNTVFWVAFFIPVILLKFIVFAPQFRHRCSRVLTAFASQWVNCNSLILQIMQNSEWDIEGPADLNPHASYLVISNHRSWADIVVLQHIFRNKIPFLKFFLKKELIWVPFLGLAWWALDFPFMKRYSRRFLEKHPELRGQDMATTRKQCEKFKRSPVSVINFVEGTRFSSSKHLSQNSPFQNLLRPRAGGVAFVLAAMGDSLSGILDVTIVYPDNAPDALIWQLLQGKIPRIVARVRLVPVLEDVAGKDYLADSDFKERMQNWVNRVWQDKDMLINSILSARGA